MQALTTVPVVAFVLLFILLLGVFIWILRSVRQRRMVSNHEPHGWHQMDTRAKEIKEAAKAHQEETKLNHS